MIKEIVWKHTKDTVWKRKIFNNSLYIKCIKDVTIDICSTTMLKCKMLRTYCGPISFFEKNSIPTSSTIHTLLHKSKSSTCPVFLSKKMWKGISTFFLLFCLLFTDSILCVIHGIISVSSTKYIWLEFLAFDKHSQEI